MTGELTLTGQVLPVGGVKEKSLAAQRAGIKRVILPDRNEGDVLEIPEHERAGLEFIYVDRIEKALEAAIAPGARAVADTHPLAGICWGADHGRRSGEVPQDGEEQAKAQRARDAVGSAADNPYLRRLMEDEDLRDSVRERLRIGPRRLRAALFERQRHRHRDRRQEGPQGHQADGREPARRLRALARPAEEAPLGPAAVHRPRRRRAGDRAQRGPAQGAARQALRRRGGVRVHLDDDPGAAARSRRRGELSLAPPPGARFGGC